MGVIVSVAPQPPLPHITEIIRVRGALVINYVSHEGKVFTQRFTFR